MIGDGPVAGERVQAAVTNELGQELGVVHDLVSASKVRVLLADGVEAVRAGGHDLSDLRLVQGADVLLGHLLERVLVAHPARGVACARLAWPEDREVDTRSLEQLRGRYRRLLGALVERRRAADPEQDVGRRLPYREHANTQPVCPMCPIRLRFAPRVGGAIDVTEHRRGLRGETRFDHDQVPAQVDDVVDVLDPHRALAHARAARHAVPHDVVGDGGRHERLELLGGAGLLRRERGRALSEDAIAQRHDQELRRELLARVVGRADILAPAALGAGHRVDHLLPREVGDRGGTEADFLVGGFEVDRLQPAARAGAAEEHVHRRDEDVQVLRVRQVDEEAEDDQHMRPYRATLEVWRPRLMERERQRARDGSPRGRVLVEAERDLARVPQQEGDDDPGDQQQDEVGLAHVAAGEAARPLDLADDESRDHAGKHEHCEGVDEERIPALLPKPGQGRVLVDEANHGGQNRWEQDDEAPEDRCMHQAREQALEQLALADDHDGLGAGARGQVVESLQGFPHPHEPVEEQRTAAEQRDRDDQDGGQGGRSDHPLSPSGRGPGRGACTARPLRSSAEMAGTISLRSPTTA